jgi:Cu2+-exporting ATPase
MSETCFHCGLPVANGISFSVEINNKKEPMCCIGCQSVAQAIVDNGLTTFYSHRTVNSQKPEDLIPTELQVYDNPKLQDSFVQIQQGSIREASLILEGIVCAACVWLNEKHVKQLEGVIDFSVNYSTHRASLKWDNEIVKLSDILFAISAIGYNAHPFDPGRLENIQKKEKSAALRRIALAGIGMMQVMMPAIAIYIGESSGMSGSMEHFLRWISLLITTPVVLYSSQVFFRAAWRDIKRGIFGMDFPVSIAIGSAYLASDWATITNTGEIYFDSVVMFTFFLLLGRFLEMGARHRSGEVADALVRLLPQTATRIMTDSKGKQSQEVIPANELTLGDLVLIKPGETVPADGSILEGTSSVNESLLTGESLPLKKTLGDQLIGGTLNTESPLTMRVDKLGDSTMLSSIIRLLDRAQREKPDLAKFADKSAGWFVGFILILAIVVFIGWWFIDPSKAFWVALTVLVITCPCALSLATPAALTAATGHLTSQGVLTTRGHALETLAKINHVIFDKTGTLTYGKLQLKNFKVIGSLQKDDCLRFSMALESVSEHPVAKAILEYSELQQQTSQQMSQIKIESGRGVEGRYENKTYRIGNKSFVQEIVNKKLNNEDKDISSTVYFGREGEWLALLEFEDEIRSESKEAIEQLKMQGVQVSLLSGDNQNVVNHVARHLGMDHAKGGLLPADKLAYVQQLQKDGQVVSMIGDGVNDAPVLAAANVSIAMGKGSQLAQASADMILLSENLRQLPRAITLSKRMQRIIHQNFGWAIIYNIVAIPIAAMGWLEPWMAALGMSMSSLLVVLNALRLKK